jgi:opacity protein-like surface antigen
MKNVLFLAILLVSATSFAAAGDAPAANTTGDAMSSTAPAKTAHTHKHKKKMSKDGSSKESTTDTTTKSAN